jgi:hypothetical protein
MNTLPLKFKEIIVDKDKFDAVLRRITQSKPLPLKDVVGTSPPRVPRKSKPSAD